MQRAAGEEDAALQNGAIIADAVMAGADVFLAAQRMLVMATRDAASRPWASVLFGRAGFVAAGAGGRTVTVDRRLTYASGADAYLSRLGAGAPVGLLAIELATRQRLRINGRVNALTDARLVLHVEQAYPNCPKYIQRRRLRVLEPSVDARPPGVDEGRVPDAALLAAVASADTLFVASGHPSRGLDASHRGGPQGFVEILAPDLFRIPDYEGNGMFNTLGNLLVDGRCGITVLDFTAGRLHQMTGQATVHIPARPANDDPPLTGRSWDFQVDAWRSGLLPVRADWEFMDASPYNPD